LSADDFVQLPVSWRTDAETSQLAALLGIDLPSALGLRESVWKWAASNCPRGVIPNRDARWFASEIGSGLDPKRLVSALIESGVLGIGADGLEITGWYESESGRYFARRSLKQSYRGHISNHVSDLDRGRVRSPSPTCDWCNGVAPRIPLEELGLHPRTIEKGKPDHQRRAGGTREEQVVTTREEQVVPEKPGGRATTREAQVPPDMDMDISINEEKPLEEDSDDALAAGTETIESILGPTEQIASSSLTSPPRVVGKDSKGRNVWRSSSGEKYVEHRGFDGEVVKLPPGQEPSWDVDDPDQAPF
jgi:hypothetical protein